MTRVKKETTRNDVLAKQRAANHRWYEKNGKGLNARRRKRYAEDQEYRDSKVAAVRDYRTKATRERGSQIYRTKKGKKVEVFTISSVSVDIGRSTATIRKWESTGMIPKPSFAGVHRVYTATQVSLLKELVELLDDHKGSVSDRVRAKDGFLPYLEHEWGHV